MDESIATRPVNGIPATWLHDEGARGQCIECGRYSIDSACATQHPPKCECGSIMGWRHSFKTPGPDARWSGPAPDAT